MNNKQIRKQAIFIVEKLRELSQEIKITEPNLSSVLRSHSLKRIKKYSHSIQSSPRQDFAIEQILADCERLRKAWVNLIFRTGFIAEKDRGKMDMIALELANLTSKQTE